MDSGNAAADPALLAAVYHAMSLMGYEAAGLGLLEAALGPEVGRIAEQAKLPLVGQLGPAVGQTRPGRTTRRVGAHTVGLVAAGWVSDARDDTYRAALRQELQASRAESSFVVLLSQLGRATDQELLAGPDFQGLADVVAGGPLTWQGGPPVSAGGALFLPASQKGRDLGVLEVQLADEQVRYHHTLLSVAKDLPDDPTVQAVVDEYYSTRQMKPQRGALVGGSDTPAMPDLFTEEEGRQIRARGYLTADECGRCHVEQYDQWQTTHHAAALKTLLDQRRAVRECLVCHAEANRRGAAYDPEGAARWGVDCSACHGAGLYHAATVGAPDTIVRKPGEIVCRRCHNEERDAGFAYAPRLAPVRH